MATPFSAVYNQFLIAVQDYDLLEQGQDFAESQLERLMKRAVSEVEQMLLRVSQLDLTKRNEDHKEFEEDLTDAEIELLVTGMEYYWVHPMLYNSENMHNVLNTRDFNQYAPQNLIFRLREINESAEDRWRRAKRHYSHDHIDLATLGGLIK